MTEIQTSAFSKSRRGEECIGENILIFVAAFLETRRRYEKSEFQEEKRRWKNIASRVRRQSLC